MNPSAEPAQPALQAIFTILKIEIIHIDSREFKRRRLHSLGFEAEERTPHSRVWLDQFRIGVVR
jgi:hypothetical protein